MKKVWLGKYLRDHLIRKTRRLLEPRTATIAKRLQTIKVLSEAGIPVNAMLAPIIPGINSHEVLPMAKAVAEQGAQSMACLVVRLNGVIGQLFADWLQKTMPNKAEKVLNQIKACHDGKLNDSRFGIRGKGTGEVAEQIQMMASIARKRYFSSKQLPALRTDLHESFKTGQLRLF